MKYLKLYEDFNNQDDILEDIKWIMIEVNDHAKLSSSVLDGDLIKYYISDYNLDDLRVANKRLQDIGYTLITCSEVKYKEFCLIVNTKLIDLSKYYNDFVLNVNEFGDIKKKLLLKHFEKTPNLVGVDPFDFFLTASEAYVYLYDFLGKDGVLKVLYSMVSKDKRYHINNYGGYDFEFKLHIEEDGDEIKLNCFIFNDGEVEIIHSGEVINIIDAMKDDEIGWEITGEMEEAIIDFFHRYVGDIDSIVTVRFWT